MKKNNTKIQITKRDIQIFHILNEIGLCRSDTIGKIVSPTTLHRTFSLRIWDLKKTHFIKELWEKEKMRNQFWVYLLNNNNENLKKIKAQTGIEFIPSFYTTSFTLYNHQILVWKLFAFLLEKIRSKNKDYILNNEDIIWTKKFQRKLQEERDNLKEYSDYNLPIPDLILQNWNTTFCLELENTNSYNQFLEKILLYRSLLLENQWDNFFSLFRKKNIFLVIACWSHKKQRYKQILDENYSWKYLLLDIESL